MVSYKTEASSLKHVGCIRPKRKQPYIRGVLEHLASIMDSPSRLRNVKSGWEAYTYTILRLQGEQCRRKNGRVGKQRAQSPEARGRVGNNPKNRGPLTRCSV